MRLPLIVNANSPNFSIFGCTTFCQQEKYVFYISFRLTNTIMEYFIPYISTHIEYCIPHTFDVAAEQKSRTLAVINSL